MASNEVAHPMMLLLMRIALRSEKLAKLFEKKIDLSGIQDLEEEDQQEYGH